MRTASRRLAGGRRVVTSNWYSSGVRQQRSIAAAVLVLGLAIAEQGASVKPLQVWLHAHNCYPDEGHGADRLARALAVRRGTIAIEQDIAWDPVRRQPVLSHDTTLDGTEPSLEAHFFRAVASELDRALVEAETGSWPHLVLHLDFKSHEPALHAAVWDLLGRHARWLTTAPRLPDAAPPVALTWGPLLVLTEAGPGQEQAFSDRVPIGERLRVFGTVPGPADQPESTAEERLDRAFTASPEVLIPSGATNYRRWTNHAWAIVERGGQASAGPWTADDRARLDRLVRRAHALGLWIRFYTLNGHGADDQGGSPGYNFGSLDLVRPRWRAAIDAGVDFIATDQYEAFGELRSAR